jgi:hypothetical protein
VKRVDGSLLTPEVLDDHRALLVGELDARNLLGARDRFFSDLSACDKPPPQHARQQRRPQSDGGAVGHERAAIEGGGHRRIGRKVGNGDLDCIYRDRSRDASDNGLSAIEGGDR